MYTREIKEPPKHIILNKKPVFGTFCKSFDSLDIRGIKAPYGGLPFPSLITNLRIRATIVFVFVTDKYIGNIEIFDSKIFGFAEVILWEKSTGRKYAYRHILGPHSRIVPKNMKKAVCLCLSKKRYIRFRWDRLDGNLSVSFKLKGDSVRPRVCGAFAVDLSSCKASELASVLPYPVMRRCYASVKTTAPSTGSLSFAGKDEANDSSNGLCLLETRRAYYALRSASDFLTGIGTIDGKMVTFRLSVLSEHASDEYTYNDNVLFVDGTVCPLPPVKITRPEGINKAWIIQDTESMVDLSFVPIADTRRKLSVLILRTDYHVTYGVFNGVLKLSDGTPLVLKDFSGMGKRIRLRY